MALRRDKLFGKSKTLKGQSQERWILKNGSEVLGEASRQEGHQTLKAEQTGAATPGEWASKTVSAEGTQSSEEPTLHVLTQKGQIQGGGWQIRSEGGRKAKEG